jgi:phage terminase Nu1 subunit (DNA packaging protein)
MSELITQSELARRLGVTRQYIYKLVKQGKIVKEGKLVDFDKASKAIKMIADPARSSAIDSKPAQLDEESDQSFAEAKTMKEIYGAKLAKLKYEEEAGMLILKSDVKGKAHEVGKNIKEVLLSLPARVMDELSVESDPRKVNSILEKEVRDSLSSLVEILKKV